MKADVLIVGGGLAGWRAAEAAAERGCHVCLVANGPGNSPHIHALNCPVLPEDSVEIHALDTVSSGKGTNDPKLVRVLCEGAAKLKDEFAFDREPDGSYRLLKPLGSTVPRCVMMGPAVGAEILRRMGYFCKDPDSTAEKPVYNRTVSLKDSWAKEAKK